MAEIELTEFLDGAEEEGVAENAARSSEGISNMTKEIYQEAQSASTEEADQIQENVDTSLERGQIDQTKDYGSQKEKTEKQIESKKRTFSGLNKMFKKVNVNIDLDPTKDLEENFAEGSENKKAMEKFNESVLDEFGEEEQAKLKEKAEMETDAEKRKSLKKTLAYVGFVSALGAGAVITCLQALADAESGCYEFKTEMKQLDCGSTSYNTLRKNCKCSLAPKELSTYCTTGLNQAHTCDNGYIYVYQRKWWWNELGMLMKDLKIAAEEAGKDVGDFVKFIKKWWWLLLIVIVIVALGPALLSRGVNKNIR